MRLATLFLLLASTASAQQGWTPSNFFTYNPMWLAQQYFGAVGGRAVEVDMLSLCIAPELLDPAPMYRASMSWDVAGSPRQSVSFLVDMADDHLYPQQICNSWPRDPLPVGAWPSNVEFTVTPLGPVGDTLTITVR